MDAETRASIEALRDEVRRDRRRLDAKSLGLVFLFQPDSHPMRHEVWKDLTGYPGGTAGWFSPGEWLCVITVPNEDNTDVESVSVFVDHNNPKASEKLKEHACEVASILEDAGHPTPKFSGRAAALAEALFQLNQIRKTLSWEKNEQPGHPETKSRIARIRDVFGETERFLGAMLTTSKMPRGTSARKAGGKRKRPQNLKLEEKIMRKDCVRRWQRWKSKNKTVRNPTKRFCLDETELGRPIDPTTLGRYVNWVTQTRTRKAQKHG